MITIQIFYDKPFFRFSKACIRILAPPHKLLIRTSVLCVSVVTRLLYGTSACVYTT